MEDLWSKVGLWIAVILTIIILFNPLIDLIRKLKRKM